MLKRAIHNSKTLTETELTLCGNFMIYLSRRFYVKSILMILEVQRFCRFRGREFCPFGNYQALESAKTQENQNPEL